MRSAYLVSVALGTWCAGVSPGCSTRDVDVVHLEFGAEGTIATGAPFDTGLVPDRSPAQVRIEATGQVAVNVNAGATWDGARMLPRAGSGSLTIRPEWTLAVSTDLDLAGLTHRGDVGLLRLTSAPASHSFDPFAFGSTGLSVGGEIGAFDFDELVVPSSDEARVIVTLREGWWSARFTGTCASTADGNGQYRAIVSFEGHLSFTARVVSPRWTVGPLELEMAIAFTETAIDLGVRSLTDGSEPASGVAPCEAPAVDAGVGSTDAGRDTCAGCTDRDLACIHGRADDACGAEGHACIACASGDVCADGTCVERGDCNADTCAGCCQDDLCRTGASGPACGSGGLACESCDETEVCFEGRCRRSCESGCSGCCFGGVCVPSDDDGHCGSAGDACARCADGETCSAGTCVTAGCAESCSGCCAPGGRCMWPRASACGADGSACVDCGPNAACVDGDCVATSAAMTETWDVHVVGAFLSAVDTNGSPWDSPADHPDPYVAVTVLDRELTTVAAVARTPTIQDDPSPRWDAPLGLALPTLGLGFINFQVLDEDEGLRDDPMSTCSFHPTPRHLGAGPFLLRCPSTSTRTEAILAIELVPASGG